MLNPKLIRNSLKGNRRLFFRFIIFKLLKRGEALIYISEASILVPLDIGFTSESR